MRLCGLCLEEPFSICEGAPAVLEVLNPVLFSRCCESLYTLKGDEAQEPYSLWDDEGQELKPSDELLVLVSPLILPWENRELTAGLYRLVQSRLYEDFEIRGDLERLAREVNGAISRFELEVEGSYEFGVEWDVLRYLKAFSYKPAIDDAKTLLEKLIAFFETSADICLNKAFVLIDFKKYFSREEVSRLYESIVFLKRKVLLLESTHDRDYYEWEIKRCVDQHFLES